LKQGAPKASAFGTGLFFTEFFFLEFFQVFLPLFIPKNFVFGIKFVNEAMIWSQSRD